MLYTFPAQASVGKTVPKSKFYEHGAIGSRLKGRFVSQIEKIVWSYKLSEETLNLPSFPAVPEIEVFDLFLKGQEIDEALLLAIDRAIPFPILFYLHRSDGRIRLKAAYKRPGEADSRKWVVEAYFQSEWFEPTEEPQPLPTALDLQNLYHLLIAPLMPQAETRTGDLSAQAMEAEIERAKLIEAKEREYTRLKARRDRQKQFNKKVELNERLHRLKEEIEALKLNHLV